MPHFTTCSLCGVLIGDKLLHDRWHRELEAKITRAQTSITLANWRPDE